MRIGLPLVRLAAPAVVRVQALRRPVTGAAVDAVAVAAAVAAVATVAVAVAAVAVAVAGVDAAMGADATADGGTAVITIPTNLNTLCV
jgi:hypothetical protein